MSFYIRRLVDGDFNENRGLSSIFNIPLGNVGGEEVNCSTVDNEIERMGIEKLDLLKIDVEGGEYYVLKGAKKTIEKFHPVIQYEYSTVIDKLSNLNNTELSFNLLKDHGYLQYLIKDETLLIPIRNVDKNIDNANILCFHKDNLNQYIDLSLF